MHCNLDRAAFLESRPQQALAIRSLQIVGEAASQITPEFRKAHPELPWRQMIGIRNRLVHAYFDVDLAIVWKTCMTELPSLILQVQGILDAPNSPVS